MSLYELQNRLVSSRTYLLKSTQAGIAMGFALLLALIFITAWLSLSQMNKNQIQTQRLIDNHTTKLELINQMRHAARERTIAMQKIILLADPFDKDDTFLDFNNFGAQFAKARMDYIALGLSPHEQSILNIQDYFVRINVPTQLSIIDLVMGGREKEAHQRLINESIPVQDFIFNQLNKLHSVQREATKQAVLDQSRDYIAARSLIISFVLAITTVGIVVALVVYSRTRRYQQALYETREQAIVTLQSIGEAVISTDSHGNVEYLNPQAELLIGYSLSEIHSKPLTNYIDLRKDESSVSFTEILKTTIHSGDRYFGINGLSLYSRTNNSKLFIELTAAPIHDQFKNIKGTVIALRDVTTLRALDDELSFQASHDSLTGLLNRREFEHRIHTALEQSRMDRDEHAVCYIDLDMFKVVNDTCGHIAGDELLRQLAMLLQQSIRKNDALARLGGDEFALLLQSCDLNKAKILAENLLKIIGNFRFHWENKTFNIGASIGLAPIRPDSGTLIKVLQTADLACYSAKDAGRNRIYISEHETSSISKRQGDAGLISRITDAIDKNQFELYFQDIKPLKEIQADERHVELLLRMKNENGQPNSPMSFIPAAERYQLMPTIDRWVFTQATTLLATARSKGLAHTWRININLSGQSLSDRNFLGFVLDQMKSSNIPSECICFEVTETAAISNLSSAIRFMNTLKGVGCHFALDDFGSGLSSFGYLKSLPIDAVKIDGLFIRDLEHDMTQRTIVSSIARIARVMKISTIAEFVENNETFNILKDLGVDHAQGYFIGRPIPLVDEIMKNDVRAV